MKIPLLFLLMSRLLAWWRISVVKEHVAILMTKYVAWILISPVTMSAATMNVRKRLNFLTMTSLHPQNQQSSELQLWQHKPKFALMMTQFVLPVTDAE
jgi:hypothetical protein